MTAGQIKTLSEYHQTGKTKKNALLTKKIAKSFGGNYLISIFAVFTTAVVTVETTTKTNSTN